LVRSQSFLGVFRQAHPSRLPAYRAQLNATLAALERTCDEHDQPAFPRTDVDLHRAIWAQADNRHLERCPKPWPGSCFRTCVKREFYPLSFIFARRGENKGQKKESTIATQD
jgi:hypothetical protein